MTPEGEVEHVNRQVLEYFGRTLEELKQWGTTDAVHPADLPRVIAAWQHAVETGLPYEFEHRIRRGDGEYRWFQSRGLPLRDAEGRIVRWYNLLTDIDDRKQSEEKLRRSEADLLEAQRLEPLRQLAHTICVGRLSPCPQKCFAYAASKSAEPPFDPSRGLSRPFIRHDWSKVRHTYEAAQKQKGEFDAEYRNVAS